MEAREKWRVNYKGTPIRLSDDFSIERRPEKSSKIYSKPWKGKICIIEYRPPPEGLSFRLGERKNSLDKQKLKEYSNIKPILK